MRKSSALVVCLAVFSSLVVAGLSSAVSAACAGQADGGDWRMMGHDYSNSRSQQLESSIDLAAARTLAPTWTFSASKSKDSGTFTGTPVVADGCVFMGSDSGTVYALNADTGAIVWSTKIPGGSVNSSVAVDGGSVYALVSRVSSPFAIALDEVTGQVRWTTLLDDQFGADVYASPVVYNGVVFAGVSGSAAETGDETDRYAFQGSFSLLDASTGAVLAKTYPVHPPIDPPDEFAGAGIWSTPAVDTATGHAYVGTGNPFNPRQEPQNSNAIIKVDIDASRATFGQIVGSYHGNVDEYFPNPDSTPCADFPGNPPPWYPQGLGQCADLDLDFGASPNIFFDSNGRKLVGAGQKSGVYHAVDPTNMVSAWKQILGTPSFVGGIVGSTAFDGTSIYGPVTVPGQLWSISKDAGEHRWFSSAADGAHYALPSSLANGVMYTIDAKGFLDAFDTSNGVPVLHRPLLLGSDVDRPVANLGGGVAIARHTVYAVGGGFIVAFKPSDLLGGSS